MRAEIAIIGAGGGVGSSVAFNLLLQEGQYDIAMVDGRSGMARSHEMDLQQVVAAGAAGSVRIVGLDEALDSHIVVITASEPLTVNRSRRVYLHGNAEVVRTVTEGIRAQGDWPGIVLLVTNPVDVLLTWLHRLGGLDRHRLLGYTANDSLRLRTAVADQLEVPPHTVDAWVLGEHGNGCVPLMDRIRVAGAPVQLDPEQRRLAEDFVRGWYTRHVALDSGRSSTWATGLGVARMVHALLTGGNDTWPASVVLEGEFGVRGAALSVPVSLGTGGLEQVHEWQLEEADRAALLAAGDAVAAAADNLA